MKNSIVEDIREIFRQSQSWLKLELEYAKLTAAEKLTVLMGSLIIGFVCLLLGSVVLVLLGFTVAELFKLILSPALAYLSAAGSISLVVLLFFLCRRALVLNPIARLITKVFFDKKH